MQIIVEIFPKYLKLHSFHMDMHVKALNDAIGAFQINLAGKPPPMSFSGLNGERLFPLAFFLKKI